MFKRKPRPVVIAPEDRRHRELIDAIGGATRELTRIRLELAAERRERENRVRRSARVRLTLDDGNFSEGMRKAAEAAGDLERRLCDPDIGEAS